MIKKERLEELIEQGTTIWDKNILVINLMNFEQKYNDGFYAHKTYIKNNQLICEIIGDYDFTNTYSLEDLFETKEDAEEYAEFGNITRTERLELNNYETFLKSNTGTMFYLNACEHLLHKVRHSADDENPDWRIEVCVFYNDLEESSEVLYSKPLTRENYNEARRLCVKLFKGEEV